MTRTWQSERDEAIGSSDSADRTADKQTKKRPEDPRRGRIIFFPIPEERMRDDRSRQTVYNVSHDF
jgi:hypothetical protein